MALVVEDDPDAAEIGRRMLEMLGWETLVAADGEEALFALSNCPPDLILLDICLPDIDGVGVLKVVRRLASTQNLPVVVASAIHPRTGGVVRSMRGLGAPDFLRKPFRLSSLARAVDAAVLTARARGRHNERARRESCSHLEVRRANVLFGGRAVEVLLEGRKGRHLCLRSWAEPLPDGGAVELEVAEPDEGHVRVLGLVSDVREGIAGTGWSATLTARVAAPAHLFERLLSALPER